MVIDSRGSDVVDPLQGYWGISLFPKTFGVLPELSKPFNPDDDLQAIHNHLKSMNLRSPSKLKKRAEVILNSGSMNGQASKDKNETNPAKAEEDHRERRPALGRKRARFSLKPGSREPAVSLEPTLDIKKLKNPEEFFMAYERLENAKREIQKQMGANLSDSDQNNPSPDVLRGRRPGIMRRSSRYKHLYSEDNSNVTTSQETFESSIPSPYYHSSQQERKNIASQEMESAGKTGYGNGKMLEDLLSHNNEVLEEDQVVNLLQDHLNLPIKPPDIDELSLPDVQDIPKIGLKSSRENLRKSRHFLPPIDNILKGINSKTPVKLRQGTENCSASPTILKNPLASLAVLKRRISQTSPATDPFSPHNIDQLPGIENCLTSPPQSKSPFASSALLNRILSVTNPANDPFSPHDIDQLPVTIHSPIEHVSKQFGSVSVGKQSVNMKSPLNEQDNNTRSYEVAIRDFSRVSENCVNEDSCRLGALIYGSSASHVAVENHITGSYTENVVMNGNLGRSDDDEDAQPNRATVEEKMEDVSREAEVVAPAHHDLDTMDSALDNSNSIQSQLGTASPLNHAMVGKTGTPDNYAELHNEIIQEQTRVTVNKKSKENSRAHGGHKDKEISRRKSLAGAGTKWKSGVRRSTRIRTRPLEYWKGERLLYGRIHESLATVIGLKYASPAKGDGKPTLKVKSFVSDEYKELVDRAALH